MKTISVNSRFSIGDKVTCLNPLWFASEWWTVEKILVESTETGNNITIGLRGNQSVRYAEVKESEVLDKEYLQAVYDSLGQVIEMRCYLAVEGIRNEVCTTRSAIRKLLNN